MAESNVEQLALALNLTPRRVQQLAKDEGMPKAERGIYDIAACTAWYIRYLQKSLEKRQDDLVRDETIKWTRERTRLAAEQAEKTRMENELRRADLAEVSVIGMVVDDLVANAKTNLLALSRRIAPGLEGLNVREREEAISAQIRQCLEDLSSYRPQRPGARSVGRDHGKDHAQGAKATAAHDGERVGGRKPRVESRGKRRAGKVANRES
jgi:phage terminase Nu1 subunit (DNA packaging protein)